MSPRRLVFSLPAPPFPSLVLPSPRLSLCSLHRSTPAPWKPPDGPQPPPRLVGARRQLPDPHLPSFPAPPRRRSSSSIRRRALHRASAIFCITMTRPASRLCHFLHHHDLLLLPALVTSIRSPLVPSVDRASSDPQGPARLLTQPALPQPPPPTWAKDNGFGFIPEL